MKTLLFFSLFFAFLSSSGQPAKIELNTFRGVPESLQGCGDSYYLSAQNKKTQTFICLTSGSQALIHIKGKAVHFKRDTLAKEADGEHIYISGGYRLTVKDGEHTAAGVEHYVMKAGITLQYKNDLAWKRDLIGDGGC